MSLPANVGFGRVTGRLIRAILDGPIDPDTEPDGVPIEGAKVTFTASVNRVVNRTATPPVSIFIDPVTVMTNSDGILVSPDGTEGVTLVASDDADLDPSGWTYKVTMTAPSISALSWSITVPEGSVQDLATAIPVPANPGTAVVEWKQLRDEVEGLRALHTDLSQHQDRAHLLSELRSNGNLSVKDVAMAPEAPISPKKSLALVAAMMVFGLAGLGVPVGTGLAKDHLLPHLTKAAATARSKGEQTPPPAAPARKDPEWKRTSGNWCTCSARACSSATSSSARSGK